MALQWNELRADFSNSATSMKNAMAGLSQAGDVFDKIAMNIEAKRQRKEDVEHRDKVFGEGVRQFDTSLNENKRQFGITEDRLRDTLNEQIRSGDLDREIKMFEARSLDNYRNAEIALNRDKFNFSVDEYNTAKGEAAQGKFLQDLDDIVAGSWGIDTDNSDYSLGVLKTQLEEANASGNKENARLIQLAIDSVNEMRTGIEGQSKEAPFNEGFGENVLNTFRIRAGYDGAAAAGLAYGAERLREMDAAIKAQEDSAKAEWNEAVHNLGGGERARMNIIREQSAKILGLPLSNLMNVIDRLETTGEIFSRRDRFKYWGSQGDIADIADYMVSKPDKLENNPVFLSMLDEVGMTFAQYQDRVNNLPNGFSSSPNVRNVEQQDTPIETSTSSQEISSNSSSNPANAYTTIYDDLVRMQEQGSLTQDDIDMLDLYNKGLKRNDNVDPQYQEAHNQIINLIDEFTTYSNDLSANTLEPLVLPGNPYSEIFGNIALMQKQPELTEKDIDLLYLFKMSLERVGVTDPQYTETYNRALNLINEMLNEK